MESKIYHDHLTLRRVFGYIPALAIPFALSVLLNSCSSGSSTDVERLTEEVKQLKEQNQQLQAKITELQSAPAASKPAPDTSSTADQSTSSTADGFTDIAGKFGENEIKDLVLLGVFDPKEGKFDPTKPVTRAEFVTWLVKANNAIRPDKLVRAAEADAKQTFPDVPSSHPNFKWIQGMSDAGWSIGYDDKTFKPDKVLSREEMIAIKAPFDGEFAGSVGATSQLGWKWADWKKITPRFIEPMGAEAAAFANWPRIYGQTKNCDPKKDVSRAEAAVCVWQFGGREFERVSAKPKKAAP